MKQENRSCRNIIYSQYLCENDTKCSAGSKAYGITEIAKAQAHL